MSAADKLQELAKMLGTASRARPQAISIAENTTIDSALVKLEPAMAPPPSEAERENEATVTNRPILPLSNLDLDTAIRLRWALRDIKAKRTKLTPVSPSDLMTLMEMGLVEMRDDAPMLTSEAHQTLDR
jgi:hypothetical protein